MIRFARSARVSTASVTSRSLSNFAPIPRVQSSLQRGFTMCPDICPDELLKMADAVGHVEKAGKSLRPVFISIDPERDTVARVKEYVAEFHPKLIGLTGSVQACKDAAKQYRVYYHKTSDDPKDYLVDHSIIMCVTFIQNIFIVFACNCYYHSDLPIEVLLAYADFLSAV